VSIAPSSSTSFGSAYIKTFSTTIECTFWPTIIGPINKAINAHCPSVHHPIDFTRRKSLKLPFQPTIHSTEQQPIIAAILSTVVAAFVGAIILSISVSFSSTI